MIKPNDKEFLWCERYRPRTIDECILPENLKKTFNNLIKQTEIPNMILSGSAGLGKTTGWAHRAGLVSKGVHMLAGVEYLKIDDAGLHIRVNDEEQVLPVDNVIICAGQDPLKELVDGLCKPYQLVGGADVATELDAKRAIKQGTLVAMAV